MNSMSQKIIYIQQMKDNICEWIDLLEGQFPSPQWKLILAPHPETYITSYFS